MPKFSVLIAEDIATSRSKEAAHSAGGAFGSHGSGQSSQNSWPTSARCVDLPSVSFCIATTSLHTVASLNILDCHQSLVIVKRDMIVLMLSFVQPLQTSEEV